MKKFIALVVMLCAVLVSSTASAADWVWVVSNEYNTFYVDSSSIRRDYNYSGYVFRAFIKCVYSNAGRQEFIEGYRSNGISPPKRVYNLSHNVELKYLKIENGIKYHGTLNCVYYDSDGNVISEIGLSYNYPKWILISPDTVGETIFDAIRARVPN